ncbi:protein STRUBBELIG-RECEPTOR FAMILY 3-like [Chenopodium quinoa]|uniref:Protein kinase domain-containing protein n=1 Tax=Chenopodium quinoa TaxID=63459 RepID=A0A803LLA7_CHEQI|nr:protein STRUBBELIG-RECEPTOR FAMILY 3-like [Chenopodium quinoa]
MGCMNLNLAHQQWTVVVCLMMTLTVSFCDGYTDPRDVFAINSLYAALGSPSLPGWIPLGGDPCEEAWQGVLCVNSNITGISLNNAGLGGELGTSLDSFSAIISINLSGNHIGGTIPANLPPTMKTLFLSDNQLTGGIPDLSILSQLTDLSLNKNNLTGGLPDSFQQLSGLINLDLSENNISGTLPPSMGNLSSLTTLHLQNNELTGLLDVIQNLPLTDLDVENNQFSGPIPPRLLTIPNFRSTGNPFNTSVLPPPPAGSPTLAPATNASLPGQPSSQQTRKQPEDSPSAPRTSNSSNSTKYIKPIVSAAIAVLLLLAIVLGVWFGVANWCKRRQTGDEFTKGNVKPVYEGKGEKPKYNESLPQKHNQAAKAFQEIPFKTPNVRDVDQNQVKDVKEVAMSKDAHSIDMTGTTASSFSAQPVPPPRHYSNENIILKPIMPTFVTKPQKSTFPSSVKSFTIASLQQYTNSFSEDNLIGEGMIGSVYRAELPDGKVFAVKKFNNDSYSQQTEDEFAQLISIISNIHHERIVNLVGYCAEHGQRLIINEYCNNATLYEALHLDDEIHNKLSWNARIRIALGAAKALEYLHEDCQPPVVHMNFKSANIHLDDNFEPLISDCGLGSLLSDTFTAQVSGGYGAPELELGTYTQQSDVFSFGVVMLELLTGRKSYDSARPRGEQFLVRWAIPQLHDIDALSKMVDPSLNGSYPSKSLSRFADIISLCVQAEPEFRPPMSEIVQDLLNMIQRES